MQVEKGKIPKGYSYPLKSSVLSNALDDAGISTHTELIYRSGNLLFEAYYWLPNENVNYDRFCIRAGDVESNKAKETRHYLESEVIPEFIVWAKEIISLPRNSSNLEGELLFLR